MTPREVIPAEISEEVEAEVSTALNKMVEDERRFSTPDPHIEKLKTALRFYASFGGEIARKALEDDDALLL
jgi:hypothetical protein